MPERTAHYHLVKPLQSEYYSVDDFNANADIIDAALKAASDRADAILSAIPSLRQEIWKTAGVYTFKAPKATFYVIECIGGGGGCTI
ncbi:MAG: hypothetical protein LBH95_09295, partial [Oscillospiraceae bacterium]|nr:hypothetical protein [Oscillospiraceae bacterium]